MEDSSLFQAPALQVLWQAVTSDPMDFQSWTALLSQVYIMMLNVAVSVYEQIHYSAPTQHLAALCKGLACSQRLARGSYRVIGSPLARFATRASTSGDQVVRGVAPTPKSSKEHKESRFSRTYSKYVQKSDAPRCDHFLLRFRRSQWTRSPSIHHVCCMYIARPPQPLQIADVCHHL